MSSYDLYHGTKGIAGTTVTNTQMHNVGVKVEVSLNIYTLKNQGVIFTLG